MSCTHSWNGTKLTVTSASGTSSADLKGEKGQDYILTEADKTEIAKKAAGLVEVPGSGGAQADWNAAEGEAGHVLHRTHWVESNGVLLKESNAHSITHPTFGQMWLIDQAPKLEVGKPYAVKYNGTAYTCVCQAAPAGLVQDPNAVAMGNFSVVGGANTGEPFAMLISHFYQEVDIIDLTGAASVRVEIRGEVYHKLDPEFLPESVYTVVINAELLNDGDEIGNLGADRSCADIYEKAINSGAFIRGVLRVYMGQQPFGFFPLTYGGLVMDANGIFAWFYGYMSPDQVTAPRIVRIYDDDTITIGVS